MCRQPRSESSCAAVAGGSGMKVEDESSLDFHHVQIFADLLV